MTRGVRKLALGGQTLLENFIDNLLEASKLHLRTTYEREIIARNMLLMKQTEVKKGIVPYKLAKKRSEGAYILPDGTVVEKVAH